MTKNQIEFQKYQEQKRSNQAQESLTQSEQAETHRANVSKETETHRANVVRETQASQAQDETERSNRAREAETHRANTVSEALGSANLSLGYSNLSEAITSHRNQEVETNRANLAREAETNRSNLAQEVLKGAQQKNQFALGLRQDETTRRGQDISATTNAYGSVSGLIGSLGNGIIRAVGGKKR